MNDSKKVFDFSHPTGFVYIPDWISQAEEDELLRNICSLSFDEVQMHGVVAKRQVVHFGWDYGYETWCRHGWLPFEIGHRLSWNKRQKPLNKRLSAGTHWEQA
jgi:hypothetical protein